MTEFDFVVGQFTPTNGRAPLALVDFHANDGPGGTPGTRFFSTPVFTITEGTNVITGLSVLVPDSLTWIVITNGQLWGLRSFDPPSIGVSDNSYLYLTGSGFGTPFKVETDFIALGIANLGAKLIAESAPPQPVPEPNTFVPVGIGLASVAAMARFLFHQTPKTQSSESAAELSV